MRLIDGDSLKEDIKTIGKWNKTYKPIMDAFNQLIDSKATVYI